MIFKIPQGKHKSVPFRFWIWFRKKIFKWEVTFDKSCVYNIAGVDQGDINKLCGVGFLPGHHTDSARFGWRYDLDKQQIELLAYCYINRTRFLKHLCYCNISIPYHIELHVYNGNYQFYCTDFADLAGVISEVNITNRHSKKFKFRLGTYFGGNKTAPHDILIKLETI